MSNEHSLDFIHLYNNIIINTIKKISREQVKSAYGPQKSYWSPRYYAESPRTGSDSA